jgi:hypothetical protein
VLLLRNATVVLGAMETCVVLLPSAGSGTTSLIAGSYRREDLSGTFTATSDGTDIGRKQTGAEWTYASTGDKRVSQTGTEFTVGRQVGEFTNDGIFIRGEGNDFTLYSTGTFTCIESGSHYTLHTIGIVSASVDPQTQDLINVKDFGVTIAADGELTQACTDRIVADYERPGAWALVEVARITRTSTGHGSIKSRCQQVRPAELLHARACLASGCHPSAACHDIEHASRCGYPTPDVKGARALFSDHHRRECRWGTGATAPRRNSTSGRALDVSRDKGRAGATGDCSGGSALPDPDRTSGGGRGAGGRQRLFTELSTQIARRAAMPARGDVSASRGGAWARH